jgi:transketolase
MGTAPRVAVEAASGFGWERWVGAPENMIGMNSFGASAPAEALYQHFGITAAAVAARVKALVN